MDLEDSLSRDLGSRIPCSECRRLLEDFAAAVKELLTLHQQQVESIMEGDGDATRFDLLIHMAAERKHEAKYAYLTHYETHKTSDTD